MNEKLINDLKPVLYDIIIAITRNELNKEDVVQKTIKALQVIDEIKSYNILISRNVDSEVPEIEKPVPALLPEPEAIKNDPVKEFIKYIHEKQYDLKYVYDLIRIEYYRFLKKTKSIGAVLEFMQLSHSGLNQIKKRIKDKENAHA
jgi:hypothetical protein